MHDQWGNLTSVVGLAFAAQKEESATAIYAIGENLPIWMMLPFAIFLIEHCSAASYCAALVGTQQK